LLSPAQNTRVAIKTFLHHLGPGRKKYNIKINDQHSTSSPVNSIHQLENDKELYLSLISLCLVSKQQTPHDFHFKLIYIDITMAVFA